MKRNDTDTAMEPDLVGGPWPRRVWLGGCLLVAGMLIARAVPGSPLRAKAAQPHRVTPVANSQTALPSAANASPDLVSDPEVRQVGRFLVRPTNIEDITDKDLVLAQDPETGELAAKPVVQTFRRTSDHLRILTIRNADGTEQAITTTNEHPFWVPGSGWVNAGDLAIGDTVTHSDGLPAEVIASTYEPHPDGIAVYNFEVADFHTYFVSASPRAPPVLVHNTCIDPSTIRFTQDSIGRRFKNGGLLRDAVADLKSGRVKPTDFPAIRIFEKDGKLWTLDNRRLLVFQKAGVAIPTRMASAAEILAESWKFTTMTDGLSIIVRGGL